MMTRMNDSCASSIEGDLRGKFLELVKRSASEEKFIEFISSSLSNKLDFKSLEIILDLTLAVVDQYGYVNYNYFDQHNQSSEQAHDYHHRATATNTPIDDSFIIDGQPTQPTTRVPPPDLSSYDGDDEEFDDTFIFPCHMVYDDCHPELLTDYHREHLKPSRNPIQIIKLPKVCEFVIETMFASLRDYIAIRNSESNTSSTETGTRTKTIIAGDQFHTSLYDAGESRNLSSVSDDSVSSSSGSIINSADDISSSSAISGSSESISSAILDKPMSLSSYLTFVVRLIKKVNKICLNERRNCRILSKTGILSVLLDNIDHLVEVAPDEQHIYLEPLIKFTFTLSDYRISGTNLKQLFKIIKNDETNLSVVLKSLQALLEHHHKILRNIQPSKSMNFPTASRTPEEIEYDRYLANSWHWRLRSKVIENKRRRSRVDSGGQFKPLQDSSASTGRNITSSWLECSLMTPLSNISPLIHNGELKFCCSMWLSVCGDLLVIESNKLLAKRKLTPSATSAKNDKNFGGATGCYDADWAALNGHWLRLTSRRRLVRRHKNMLRLSLKPRKRRLSAKIRTRQAYDQEDEEREEKEEKARKSDAEVTQGHSRSGRGFKLFHSSLRRHPGSSINHSLDKKQDYPYKVGSALGGSRRAQGTIDEQSIYISQPNQHQQNSGSGEATPRPSDHHSQEQLIHMISFALDSLTIEVWLNVKCMTFYARTCRVTREGQTDVHDSVTFRSHLKANGAWSNVIFCLEEENEHNEMKAINLKVIVNGIHEECVRLVYSNHKSPLTNFALLIGCERSTFGYVWKLSQVNLYKNIPDDSMPIYLLGKGPDFWSFTNFRQQSLLPLPDITQRHTKIILNYPEVLLKYSTIDEDQTLNWLTQNIVISYVAHQSEHFLDYSPSMTSVSLMNPLPSDYEFSNSAERFIQAKTLDFSRSLKFNQNNGFGSALVEAGGIESVLMSFAEVVRRSHGSAHQTHALALSVLLKMVQTNLYHLNKFLDELNGLKLIEYVLAHPKCQVSPYMLESYLNFCLIIPDDSTRSLIKSPKLIYHLMTSWRVWHKDAKVAKMLYRRLIKLLHTSAPQIHRRKGQESLDHHYIDHNFRMMSQAGSIDILMDIIRDCLMSADDNSPPYIDHELIDQIVHLISLLISQPPPLDVMLDIMEFLLFLHPDPKAFVELTQDKIGYLHTIEAGGTNDGIAFDYDEDDAEQASGGIRTPYSSTTSDVSDDRDDDDDDSMRSSDVGDDRRRERSSSTGSSKSSESLVCSNRNYAIARIADVLHFTMILPLSHSNSANKTLTEALQKLIIDPRKFIILANNDMPLVREKVLRLFLHFIRACYKSNIRSVLNDYDQATESPNYTICTPIHLMARQLVRYRTTTRMIQLCHGILGGVSEFEAADTYSISFDIETNDIQFQLNTLVLLIQLLTKQPEPKELIAGLRIVHAYIKKLVRIDEEVTVSVIITNDLIDCLMSLYFSYVKKIITSMAHRKQVTTDEEDEDDEVIPGGDDYDALLLELDRLLVFIVRFYLQTKTTNNLVKSLDKLLLYLELINSHIPTQHKQLLRDRMVKVFLTMLKFCNHYELCAKKRSYSGTFQYYFKLMLKNSDLNKFGNELPEFGPSDLIVDENDWPPSPLSSPPSTPSTPSTQPSSQRFANIKGEQDINSSLNYVAESSGNGTSIETAATGDGTEQQPADPMITTHGHLNNGTSLEDSHLACHQREIRESAVIERFKTTFALISSFVTTREPEVIPSPLERGFIMKCVKLLARYLTEIDYKRQNSKQTTQWVSILAKLERFFRACFTRLILYLLAPTSDGMNLDERRYYARQILDQDMFTVDQLLNMLGKSSQSRSHHKILLVFIKDLMTPLEEVNQSEDELPDDTEIKLSELMCGLEARMDGGAGDGSDTVSQRSTRFEMGLRLTSNRWWGTSNSGAGGAGGHEEGGDQKYRAIWLEDLAKAREDLRERVEILKNDIRVGNSSVGGVSGGGTGGGAGNPKQTIAGSSLEDLALSSSDEIDKFLDEAVSITKDVVNDKHEQRKAYLEDVKQNKIYNYHIRQQWLSIIIGHTHERAIWYLEDYYPKSWELNPVEGPSRTRRRLRPCKLKLEERFLRQPSSALHNHLLKQNIFHDESTNATTTRGETDCDERRSIRIPHGNGDKSTTAASYRRQRISQSEGSDNSDDSESADWYSLYSPHPLCSLIINNEQSLDSNELRIRMFTTDKIHFNCDCSIIRPNEVCHGEVSIASWCIHFIGNRSDEDGNCGSGVVTMNDLRVCKLSSSKRFALYQNTSNDRSNKLLATPTTTTVSKLGATGTPQTMINATTTTTVVEDLWFDEIVEIWDRRYQLQEVGLEIFLTNNMTYLLSFRTNADREDFKQNLMREQHKMINLQRFNLATSLTRLTQLWRDAKLTNFDYLTCLNKLAGRSFNDLMQYPVFPFILSNYTSDMLDLDERGNFRNLRKPMAIQNEEREINFKNNYQMSSSSGPAIGSSLGLSKPYHYGNHYSNSATVLHFLVRLPPFTQMLIEYQDNNFDQPDRTFHAMSNTWQLITRDSNTDFKELIPEFFFLPEMFTNIGNLELGRKQNNELVDDVKLPPWCPNSDARLFTLIHRQALESATVSENLHHWIDLIFGYKQTGKHAVEALNVFHPATYYGGIDFSRKDLSRGESGGGNNADSLSAINLSIVTKSAKSSAFGSVNSTTEPQQIIGTHHLSSTGGWNSAGEGTSSMESGGGGQPQQQQQLHQQSPRRLAINKFLQADIERSALETMIKTYGQMPRQLFSSPMKQRSASSFAHGQQQQSEKQRQRTSRESSTGSPVRRPLEPLRQVKGLRWGSYVGSPNDSDVIAVKHKRIILEPVKSNYRIRKETKPTAAEGTSGDGSDRTLNKNNSAVPFGPKLLSKQSDKFHFCLLANGDVAILRNNTSLMLDYRADRKSSGTYQLSIPSARYSRRAGLSRVSRMNLFSNMIISRQQFSFLEPVHSPSNQFNSDAAAATPAHQSSSLVATLTGGAAGGGSRNKFSLDSLNLVSWFYIDGVVRVKHPAPSNQKPSIPLVQANTIVDTMTTCCSVPELNLLLVGYQSGSICAHIVSTAYETVPIQKKNSVVSIGASSLSGGPSAVHFININSSGSATMDASLLGPGRVTDKTSNGEPYTPLSLAGKTLQSVRSMNKTSRWLYCHDKRINCIKINVSFGIVVTGSDDGTSVIWDLNSLTFVRTIDYKLSSLRIRKKDQDETMKQQQQRQARPKPQTTSRNTTRSDHSVSWTYGRARRQNLYDHLCTCDPCPQLAVINDSESSPQHQPHQQHQQRRHQPKHCSICASGVSLIAISDTLGDIVTIKHLKNRSATASEPTVVTTTTARHQHHVSSDHGQSSAGSSSTTSASSLSCSSTINSTSSESSLSSVIYVHTINGSLVNFVNCQTQVTAVNYSNAPEGISINVVAVGTVDGSVRLYSSWDLSLVKAFKVENLVLPISDIMYTRASQLMYIAYEDGQMVVLRNKKRRSVTLPKEWIL